MTENSETQEAPNWLSELEKKREIRLKARLGHEAGAGAPCIKCEEKCPGLDLHFWRKICKNCKCSKEDHDVHDDDIYGWAQFQLLGSKPNKIRKKIVLPGKKDEVELEWAPKGNTETIDKYLKTLAPESLPVKGSQAAQDRKQLLQKQIPIHDIDPTLCHELTDSELAKMQDYIKHMKNSAGVGQVIQFGLHYGRKHNLNEANVKVVSDRFPKGVPTIETVQLMGERKSGSLTKQFEKLGVQDQKELDAFFDKIPKPHNMTAHTEKLGYGTVTVPEKLGYGTVTVPEKLGYVPQIYNPESQNVHKINPNFAGSLERKKLGYVEEDEPPPLPTSAPPFMEINQNVANQGARFAREQILNQPGFERAEPGAKYGAGGAPIGYASVREGKGAAPVYSQDLNNPMRAPNYAREGLPYPQDLNNPMGAPNYMRDGIGKDLNNPVSGPNYGREMAGYAGAEPEFANEINRNSVNFPHYVPGSLNIQSEQQNPSSIGNIRDLPYATHDLANSNYRNLQAYNPNQLALSESHVTPSSVHIGAIRDIEYETPEIKQATMGENAMYEGLETGAPVPEDVQIETKQCRKCSKFFNQGEFAIFVEKSNALYHSDCFKCAGCNQNLADLFYFYDKESDNIYCGRDFAKIRGIPRCKACDELIFVKEYCLAENSTFHLKHFCCFECDQALAGQNYVVEDSQPVCLPCFEKLKANNCITCSKVIRPDEQGVSLAEGIHFHAADECFCCWMCKKSLHGAKLLFRNNKLYCSHDCFRRDQ